MSELRWFRTIQGDPLFKGRSPGQIVVILAGSMLALLMAVGVAIDAGLLYARQAQLSRSVDAAALAGVIEYQDEPDVATATNYANARGIQVMAANGIGFTTAPVACDFTTYPGQGANWATTSYCGQQQAGRVPGATRYYVQARWQSTTTFVHLFGIRTVPLRAQATSEYLPLVDLFSNTAAEYGLISTATLSTYGPYMCTARGDAFFPWFDVSHSGGTWAGTKDNPNLNLTGGAYNFRIAIPQNYVANYNKVRVELWDPDSGNINVPDLIPVTSLDGITANVTQASVPSCPENSSMCFLPSGQYADGVDGGTDIQYNEIVAYEYYDLDADGNPGEIGEPLLYWVVNADEYVGNGGPGYDNNYSCDGAQINDGHTRGNNVVYRLYYYRQASDGSLEPVDLAFYISKARINPHPNGANMGPANWTLSNGQTAATAYQEALDTDGNWVSPGARGDDLMPAFTRVMDQAGAWISDPAVNGILANQPAEPLTYVEDCNAFQAAHHTNGSIYAPSGLHTNAVIGCSGDGDFTIDLTTETPGIYVDPATGNREIFLQVTGMRGTGENAMAIWAGPSPDPAEGGATAQAPANANWRQIHVVNSIAVDSPRHSSEGVAIYAIGYMPMNSLVNSATEIPMTYLGPQFQGQNFKIEMWDSDTSTTPPFTVFFDSLARTDWRQCWGRNYNGTARDYDCEPIGSEGMAANTFYVSPAYNFGDVNVDGAGTGSNQWTEFSFQLPGPGNSTFSFPFYGGRMIVIYDGGRADTYTWRVSLDARPTLVQ